jgi:hypothetical protein
MLTRTFLMVKIQRFNCVRPQNTINQTTKMGYKGHLFLKLSHQFYDSSTDLGEMSHLFNSPCLERATLSIGTLKWF